MSLYATSKNALERRRHALACIDHALLDCRHICAIVINIIGFFAVVYDIFTTKLVLDSFSRGDELGRGSDASTHAQAIDSAYFTAQVDWILRLCSEVKDKRFIDLPTGVEFAFVAPHLG